MENISESDHTAIVSGHEPQVSTVKFNTDDNTTNNTFTPELDGVTVERSTSANSTSYSTNNYEHELDNTDILHSPLQNDAANKSTALANASIVNNNFINELSQSSELSSEQTEEPISAGPVDKTAFDININDNTQ